MKQGNKVRLIGGPIVAHNWAPKGIEGVVLSSEAEDGREDAPIELWRVNFTVNGEIEDWWVAEHEVEMIESAL